MGKSPKNNHLLTEKSATAPRVLSKC